MKHNTPRKPSAHILKHIDRWFFLSKVRGVLLLFSHRSMRQIGSVSNGSLIHDGYSRITVKRRTLKRSHICFYLFHGRWPKNQLDHIDDVKTNDDPRNLREVTDKENQAKRWKR